MKTLKIFVFVQALVILIGTLVLAEIKSAGSAASFAAGGGVILLSILSLSITFALLFRKKFVALSISIIVFKYAILGLIIYKLLSFAWMDRMWFSAGLASLVVGVLLYALVIPQEDDEDEENKI